MKIYTTLPQDDLKKVPGAAAAAEDDGYDGLMTLENRHDPFLPLAVAATSTRRIALLTGLAIAFPRSPMVIANLGWDLQSASDGRFVLGLGSQVRGHNERRFSVPWSAPAPRMREYIAALGAIWRCWRDGEKLSFEGAHYNFSLMTPAFVPEPMSAPLPAVTIGAVGPAMLRVAADMCDGVRLHPFCTRRYQENIVLPLMAAGLKKRGLARAAFEVTGGGFIATGADDEAVARKLAWVRQRVAFYGSTRAYWPVLRQHDLEDLGHKLHEMAKGGKWRQMADEISDDVLELFAVIGRHDDIAGAVATRFAGLSDAIYASTAPDLGSDMPPGLIADIQRIPAIFKEFSTTEEG
ncbi:MAG: TIGR03617 family F420-dependent LLM class oxidoreductase [Alphaproteobacteria bacterium]|jgi:probable F420-dependent oxidoreductase|nr:TIGR03617 family F420-dependent LLM class oxidoreductase [Alphaproteobacteria bacterium]